MKRRAFIVGLGSAAACTFAARAQQPQRRVAILMTNEETDPRGQARVAAFRDPRFDINVMYPVQSELRTPIRPSAARSGPHQISSARGTVGNSPEVLGLLRLVISSIFLVVLRSVCIPVAHVDLRTMC